MTQVNLAYCAAMTPEKFVEAGGVDRIQRAVSSDPTVKAALAYSRALPEDIAQDAIESLLQNFDAIVSQFEGTDLVGHLVGRGCLYAKSAAESTRNGYHSRHRSSVHGKLEKRKPVPQLFESDCVDKHGQSTFEAKIGSSEMKPYMGGMLASLPPQFRRALYRDRHDLYDNCLNFIADPESLGWEERLELSRAYDAWIRTGGVPNPGKVGFYSLPPLKTLNGAYCPIPSGSEVIVNADWVYWRAPDFEFREMPVAGGWAGPCDGYVVGKVTHNGQKYVFIPQYSGCVPNSVFL